MVLTELFEGKGIPEDYVVIDVEGSGFSEHHDFVTEIGYCLVRDKQPVDRYSCVLDWTRGPWFTERYARDRMDALTQSMAKSGRRNHMSVERMQSEGIDPGKACEFFLEFIRVCAQSQLFFVGHNLAYDERMLGAAFRRTLDIPVFQFPEDAVIDTGALAKISQVPNAKGIERIYRESYREYFLRIARRVAVGVKWSLEPYCTERYNLSRHFPADSENLQHSAAWDSWVTHLLLEEFRTEQTVMPPALKPAVAAAPSRKQRHFVR